MKYVILSVLPLLLATPLRAAKRAFSIADQFRIVKVSDLDVSPDGRWIAYVTTHHQLDAHQRWSHIWITQPDGTGRRRLIARRGLRILPAAHPGHHALIRFGCQSLCCTYAGSVLGSMRRSI